jgi:hypothetical protein
MNRREYLRNLGTGVLIGKTGLQTAEKFPRSIGSYELLQSYESTPRPFLALYDCENKKRIAVQETEMGRYRLSMLQVDTENQETKTAGWYHHDLDRIREKLKQWCRKY